MNIKAFFVDALASALELKIGTPDDVLRHVTPDVLATHLPRPLWARLLTACLGAPRVDAQLVVETIGIPNLCEHVPAPIIWACISEIGARSLGKTPDIEVPADTRPRRVTAPPAAGSGATPASISAVLAPPPDERPAPPPAPTPPQPVAIGPSIPPPAPTAAINQPLADLITELENDTGGSEPRLAKLRPRSPTAERFRQSNTGVGRLSSRRPQAAAPAPSSSSSVRRGQTEIEAEPETHVSAGADWGNRNGNGASEVAVDDSQLVEWKADGGATDDDFSDLGRKR